MAKKLNGLKIHDSAFKFMVELDPQHLLDRFAIPYTFREFLPTENVLSIDSRYSMDCLILTNEGVILNLEFQSTYPKKRQTESIVDLCNPHHSKIRETNIHIRHYDTARKIRNTLQQASIQHISQGFPEKLTGTQRKRIVK